MNQAEQNRAVLGQMHAAVAQKGLTAQLTFFAPTGRFPGGLTSRDGLEAVFSDIQTTFPDLTLEVHELIAEGDRVIGLYTCTGTHLGVQRVPYVNGGFLAGVAPTGQKMSVRRVEVHRLENGLIVEFSAVQDNLGMARQLGFELSTPGQTGYASPEPIHSSKSLGL